MVENQRDCEMWLDALRAKYRGEGKFEREDWDRLLGHCQASVKACFYTQESNIN